MRDIKNNKTYNLDLKINWIFCKWLNQNENKFVFSFINIWIFFYITGGFKQFAQYFPQMCKSKKAEVRSNQVNSHYYDEQDQNQSVLENANMTEITPYLYLGNEVDAKNTQRLAQMGIHYVLNVTKNIPFYENPTSCKQQQQQQQQFTFKRIPVNDCINQNLREYFDEAIDFIGKWLSNFQTHFQYRKITIICFACRSSPSEQFESIGSLSGGRESFADDRDRLFNAQIWHVHERSVQSCARNEAYHSAKFDIHVPVDGLRIPG